MLVCNKCQGKMFLDTIFSELGHYELFCIACGKRPMISKESETGKWLTRFLETTT